MNLTNHLTRFWILMAVLGSSASGADDPPIFHPFSVTIGEQEAIPMYAPNADSLPLTSTQKKEPLKPGGCLMNVVVNGKTLRVVFTMMDPNGVMKFPKVKEILKFLKVAT